MHSCIQSANMHIRWMRSSILFSDVHYPSSASSYCSAVRYMLDLDCGSKPTANLLRVGFARNRAICTAETCLDLEDFQKAQEAFKEALWFGLPDHDNVAWKNLGDAYKALGKFDDAAAAYGVAIETGFYEWE
jgi:tetratricopeptide (TPR) repeat protein